jgi:hypothetical protein
VLITPALDTMRTTELEASAMYAMAVDQTKTTCVGKVSFALVA